MKRTVKIMSTILMAMMLVATLASTALAANGVDVGNIISGIETGSTVSDTSNITTVGANIVNIIQVVGIVIAVVVLLVIGIKYLIGSAQEKAEYKKTMIPYIVGAILIFAGTSLVKVIYQLANEVKIS